MKNRILLTVFLLIASTAAYAQLAGTDRQSQNLWITGDRKLQFGPKPNASIQYSDGNLVIDVEQGGGHVSFPDGLDLGAGNLSFGSSLVFEGATANAFETTLSVTDPTADRSPNLPDASGTVILSTSDIGAANSVSGTTNGFIFEGATADAFETTLAIADPGADHTVTVAAVTGQVCIGGALVATAGANTACNTTCGAGKCCGAQDTDAAGALVGCAAATADICSCMP